MKGFRVELKQTKATEILDIDSRCAGAVAPDSHKGPRHTKRQIDINY